LYTHEHFEIWHNFQLRVKHARRFFDSDSQGFLADILDNIESFSIAQSEPPIKTIHAGKTMRVYRARLARNAREARKIVENPSKELGPPLPQITRAGRMNSAGIPVFYGGLEIDTCVAELRPPVGSFVVYGTFDIKGPAKILDLTVLERKPKFPPMFEEDAYRKVTRWKFLQSFHHQISRAVQPEDEPIEYVPAQAVAEYIRNVLGFDGIIYSSAQAGEGGKNIVLFKVGSLFEGMTGQGRGLVSPSSHHDPKTISPISRTPKQLFQYVPDTAKVVRVSEADFKIEPAELFMTAEEFKEKRMDLP
jgi:hypothetical protein